MGSRKKETTGISLLSMYNDEDDEMENAESESESDKEVAANEEVRLDEVDSVMGDEEEDNLKNGRNGVVATESNHYSQQPGMMAEQLNDKKSSLNFVDYGHDEVAMSPEAEREIHAAGQDNRDSDVSGDNGEAPQKDGTKASDIRLLGNQISSMMTSIQIWTSQIASKDEDMCEINGVQGSDDKSFADVDPLDLFLPPPPKEKCSQELQDKINKFLALKKSGKSFNKEVRNKKAYRNPDFLLHAVTYQEIDQIGSCFTKDVFDPHGYDKSDYYVEIEADMKRELERKEQERKKNNKLEFIAGGIQPGIIPTALKPSLPSIVPNLAVGGPSSVDAAPREGRQNKKSKWDKVDGDQGSQYAVGQDSRTAVVGAHTTLSSANGTGYPASGQQRRREAEEKISSDRRRCFFPLASRKEVFFPSASREVFFLPALWRGSL